MEVAQKKEEYAGEEAAFQQEGFESSDSGLSDSSSSKDDISSQLSTCNTVRRHSEIGHFFSERDLYRHVPAKAKLASFCSSLNLTDLSHEDRSPRAHDPLCKSVDSVYAHARISPSHAYDMTLGETLPITPLASAVFRRRAKKSAQHAEGAPGGEEEGRRAPGSRGGNSRTPYKEAARQERAGGGLAGMWYAVAYSLSSCCLQVVNKTMFVRSGIRHVFALAAIQSVHTLTLLSLISLLGLYKIPSLRDNMILRMLPLSILATANSCIGMVGLRLISLPMFLGIRRMVTPMALLLEYVVWGRVEAYPVVGSLCVLSTGSLVAALFDAEFAPLGYMFTFCANVLTVGYTMYVKQVQKCGGGVVSVMDMLFYNSLVGLPLMSACSWLSGELDEVFRLESMWKVSVQVEIAACSLLALFYQYALFQCTVKNSPLTTSIAGNFKDLASSIAGVALEGRLPTFANGCGLCLSLFGAFSYVYQKLSAERLRPGAVQG